jgi:hypothetical protein
MLSLSRRPWQLDRPTGRQVDRLTGSFRAPGQVGGQRGLDILSLFLGLILKRGLEARVQREANRPRWSFLRMGLGHLAMSLAFLDGGDYNECACPLCICRIYRLGSTQNILVEGDQEPRAESLTSSLHAAERGAGQCRLCSWLGPSSSPAEPTSACLSSPRGETRPANITRLAVADGSRGSLPHAVSYAHMDKHR